MFPIFGKSYAATLEFDCVFSDVKKSVKNSFQPQQG